ncbi:Uma2 family endonuclease [Alkalinema sp. FACHB-956]|uniref:Uma2 family endonuclease n=1 Tax=Alkalinema sp. FACHB-956 TaxID=2692768 RepID=UPI0016862F12|nr:Uma2 family endonuclease [Alkalinema sp. FACHB-956]MBD2328555.1 Uma2 family endonuclease [Alkalinema sp. FACHB-956]
MTLSNTLPSHSFPLEPTVLKRWTVQDYHRMSEVGILAPNERTELIAGHITLMVAKGTAHVTSLHLLANTLRDLLGSTALIRTQDPIQLDDFSEPEPDLAIVKGNILDYADHHPCPRDVLLVVEVADSTLKQDCEIKDKLYAQAGIPEYWVLDLKNRQLHIFRNPTATSYTSHLILTEPNEVSPLEFPHLTLTLSDLLPPVY